MIQLIITTIAVCFGLIPTAFVLGYEAAEGKNSESSKEIWEEWRE